MKKNALVLGGGGSRGGYEIGVWKALDELEINIDMVMGTSVGAINGAMVAQGDLHLAEKLWQELETAMVFDIEQADEESDETSSSQLPGLPDTLAKLPDIDIAGMPAEDALAYAREIITKGGAGNSGLKGLLTDYVDEKRVRSSNILYGLVTTEFPSFEGLFLYEDDIPNGQLIDYILASASCFPAVQKCIIGDKKFIDGGYRDNMPVEMAVKKGADTIIAVDLQAAGFIRKDTVEYARKNTEKFYMLKNSVDLGNFLIFNKANTVRIIRLGYLDTMRAFAKFDGVKYTFVKDAFSEHELTGADNAAYILRLDPCTVYDPANITVSLKERIEKFTPEIKDVPVNDITIDKIVSYVSKAASSIDDGLLHSRILIYIARNIKEEQENSLFLQPAVFRLLEDEIQAANFLVNIGLV